MEGYQQLSPAKSIFFGVESLHELVYSTLKRIVEDTSIKACLDTKNYTGKIVKSKDSNFAFLVAMHKPSGVIAVLSDLVERFSKKRIDSELFSFQLGVLRENPEPGELYMVTVLEMPAPVSKLNILARVKNEKINQITSSTRILNELLTALAPFNEKLEKTQGLLLKSVEELSVKMVSEIGWRSFSTKTNKGTPVKSDYNLAYWIEQVYLQARCSGYVVRIEEDIEDRTKHFQYCDLDYSVAVVELPSCLDKTMVVLDQNCGFLIEYLSPMDYRIYCADLTNTGKGLGDFQKETNILDLYQKVKEAELTESIDKENFWRNNASVIVENGELKYISSIACYCIGLDLKGALMALTESEDNFDEEVD